LPGETVPPAPANKRRAWWAFRQLATDGSLAIIKRLLRDTGAFAWRYALVLLLGAFTAGTAALNAWLIKDVINEVFLNHRIDLLFMITAVVLGKASCAPAACTTRS